MNRPIEDLSKSIGENWTHINSARANTESTLQKIRTVLNSNSKDGVPIFPNDGSISVVAFGSLARYEFTSGSDLDWTMLVDGPVDTKHLDIKRETEKNLEELDLRGPGQEGTFGEMVFSHDLVHQIGGDEDTNRNTTRRCLMLLESIPIFGDETAYRRVINAIITRYLEDDPNIVNHVPRFLLNDFVRYWRTMAVDFVYKRRKRYGKGAALRLIKLRFSRKLLFASGLLSCFACPMKMSVTQEECPKADKEACIQCLGNLFKKSPLEIIALYFLKFSEGKNKDNVQSVASNLFGAYDQFLGVLQDEEVRKHLDNLQPDELDEDSKYQQAREWSHTFNKAILDLFFHLDEELGELTKTYGVF